MPNTMNDGNTLIKVKRRSSTLDLACLQKLRYEDFTPLNKVVDP